MIIMPVGTITSRKTGRKKYVKFFVRKLIHSSASAQKRAGANSRVQKKHHKNKNLKRKVIYYEFIKKHIQSTS